jgi:hypothetical protein
MGNGRTARSEDVGQRGMSGAGHTGSIGTEYRVPGTAGSGSSVQAKASTAASALV